MPRVRSHGADLYYERHGEGPAILFCHGAGSNAATWWQQVPRFSRSFSCIVHDHRGFGRSSAPPEPLHPQLLVDDALAILDAEGLARAALVCQSLGGITGLRLALYCPDRVWAFAACDSPLGIDHPAMRASIARSSGPGMSRLEERALARSFVAQRPELAYLYGQIHRFNPWVTGPGADEAAWRSGLLGLLAPEHLEPVNALRTLACPTLFVVGAEDPLVTPEIVRELAGLVPGAELAEIEGAGHSPYFEQPAAFNARLAAFLSRNAPRA